MKKWLSFLEITFDGNRIYGLDILRAASILFVVASHGNNLLPAQNNPIAYFILDGVSIFFVLSGFLIGQILIKTLEHKTASFATLLNFYIRRWFRTLPTYFLILSIVLMLHYLFSESFKLDGLYKYFFFSQNLFTPHPNFFGEAWSLSIEEWFYLLIPAGLFLLVGIFHVPVKKAVLMTAITVLMLTILFRYLRYMNITVENINEWDLMYRKQVATRLDSIMFGLLGAYIFCYKKMLWSRHRNTLLILGAIIVVGSKILHNYDSQGFGLYFCVFSFSITAIGILFLLPFFSTVKSGSGVVYGAITYLSLISYSMYLINLSLIQELILSPLRALNLDGMFYTGFVYALYWLLTVFVSILIYKFFEKPFTDLREKM